MWIKVEVGSFDVQALTHTNTQSEGSVGERHK